jgi:hypothetical protein
MHTLKSEIINACRVFLEEKIHALKTIMQELSEAANADAKSSAGDKHETARAMVQLEQEKTGAQLKEAEEQLMEFNKHDFSQSHAVIGQGSLIGTDKAVFFVAGSIGKLEVNGQAVFVISNRSPLALVFNSKKQKDTVIFNGVSYLINSVI